MKQLLIGLAASAAAAAIVSGADNPLPQFVDIAGRSSGPAFAVESQNDLRAHFGLGAATRADRIEVAWPSSGRVETVTNVPANQIVTIEEGRGTVARQPCSR